MSLIDWNMVYKNYDKCADNIIWIVHSKDLRSFRKRLSTHAFINDLALINAISKSSIKFKIYIGYDTSKFKGRNVFFTISKTFNVFGLSNHALCMIDVIKELEKSGYRMFPSSYECSLWENKGHMHKIFSEREIPTPKTIIINNDFNVNEISNLNFPLLLKECHSAGSAGILKINSLSGLKKELKERFKFGQQDLLIQELIEMRMDLRVILIEDKIELFYWRINKEDQWKPTSTGHGSSVDFEFFPEEWKDFIIESFKKIGIRTGAFDITWKNDDLSNIPLFLEISPAYMPNPGPRKEYLNYSYAEYKKINYPFPYYYADYIEVVFNLKEKLVRSYTKNLN